MGNLTVKAYGETVTMEEGSTLLDLAKQYQKREKHDIVMAYLNGKLCELFKPLQDQCEVQFLTTADEIGFQSYKRSATLLMLKAIDDVMGIPKIFRCVSCIR